MCRSSSGSVPLPIEPKPIITMRAVEAGVARGHWSCQSPGVRRRSCPRACRTRRAPHARSRRVVKRRAAASRDAGVRDQARRPDCGIAFAGRADQAARAVERARHEFEREQAVLLVAGRAATARRSSRPRSRSGRSTARRRPAARRDGRALLASRERTLHQRRCRCRGCGVGMHRERAEQQRRAAAPGRDVPEPHGADDAAVFDRDERQAVGRQAAFAQALGGLGEAARRRRRRSSSASRAATSAGRSLRIVTMATPSRPRTRRRRHFDRVAGKGSRREPAPGDVRCG